MSAESRLFALALLLTLGMLHLWTISELDQLQKQVMQMRAEIQIARPN